MSKSPNKAKQKFGENCINYFFVINIAIFVTPYINGNDIEWYIQLLFTSLSFVILFIGINFLKEDTQKPLPGKWKRIKVKKDTTIHIEELS